MLVVGRPKKTKGTLLIEKTFPSPVGKIRRRSGLVTKDQLDRLKSSLQELWSSGRIEELVRFRDGRIDSSRIVQFVETGTRLGSDEDFLDQLLFPTLREWTEDWYNNDRTRSMLMSQIDRLEQDTRGTPHVRDLPKVVESYRRSNLKRGVTSPFISIRNLTRTFVRHNSEDGLDSVLYKRISKIPTFSRSERQVIGRNNSRNPFSSPSQLDKYFKLHSVPVDLQEWISFLCLTGIHRSEIEKGLVVSNHPVTHLRVRGTKTEHRFDRRIPLVQNPPESDFPSRDRLRRVLKLMDGRSEYDTRRTFSVWCLRSGIPQNHISTYMGHSVGNSQTTEYQKEEVFRWIPEDSRLLKNWLEQEMTDPVRLDIPVIPVTSFEELGETKQYMKMNEVRSALDRVLDSWYSGGFMRKRYRLKEGCFEEVPDRTTFLTGKISPKKKN